jgi:hypothetical protein
MDQYHALPTTPVRPHDYVGPYDDHDAMAAPSNRWIFLEVPYAVYHAGAIQT